MVSAAWAEPMPQAIAAHFCQLLVKTQEGRLLSLHAFLRQTATANDSLTIEQQFVDYVFRYGGWQSLRIFPHQQSDGTVVWLSPDDTERPATLTASTTYCLAWQQRPRQAIGLPSMNTLTVCYNTSAPSQLLHLFAR